MKNFKEVKKFNEKSIYEIINSFCLNLLHYLNKTNKNLTNVSDRNVILCFHSIDESNWRFSVKKSVFYNQLYFLKSKKKLVKLSELINSKNKNSNLATITFDDGYEDTYKNAFPIMHKLKIKGTIFVIGDNSTVNHKELGNTKKMMTIKQIQSLYKSGWEIGYHTKTHADLRDFDREGLIDEIKTSKERLEKKLGFKIRYFAYPKGIYADTIISIVKGAKYKAAFTVDAGSFENKNRYKLSRISLEGDTTLKEFEVLLTPFGLATERILFSLLKIKDSISYRFRKVVKNDKVQSQEAF